MNKKNFFRATLLKKKIKIKYGRCGSEMTMMKNHIVMIITMISHHKHRTLREYVYDEKSYCDDNHNDFSS